MREMELEEKESLPQKESCTSSGKGLKLYKLREREIQKSTNKQKQHQKKKRVCPREVQKQEKKNDFPAHILTQSFFFFYKKKKKGDEGGDERRF